jgi:hypothetical protein
MERENTIDDAGQGFKYERTEERMEGKTTGGEFDFEKDGDIGTQQYPHRKRGAISAVQVPEPRRAAQRTTITTRLRSTRSCTGCTSTQAP